MNKFLMSGNFIIGEAAIRAGCRFYAGYPITPQNELAEYMAANLSRRKGCSFIQAESELASINMVLGASVAGARAMTSSSSPGISLKQEGISFMAGMELPAVIVNPTTPLGPHDYKPTPTGRIVVDFLNGRMPAYVEAGFNFVDVEDVAAGHLLALKKGTPGQRYLLGNQNMSFKEMLELLGQIGGRKPPRWRLPLRVALVALVPVARAQTGPEVARTVVTTQNYVSLEPVPRGAYTGSLGYVSRRAVDFNILIRSFLLRGQAASFRAGAGIVADSVAARELDETRAKARGLLRALDFT